MLDEFFIFLFDLLYFFSSNCLVCSAAKRSGMEISEPVMTCVADLAFKYTSYFTFLFCLFWVCNVILSTLFLHDYTLYNSIIYWSLKLLIPPFGTLSFFIILDNLIANSFNFTFLYNLACVRFVGTPLCAVLLNCVT